MKSKLKRILTKHPRPNTGHPNVVRYYSKLEDDDWVYIVMALCDETLESRVANGGLAPRAARAAACAELCAGLGYL